MFSNISHFMMSRVYLDIPTGNQHQRGNSLTARCVIILLHTFLHPPTLISCNNTTRCHVHSNACMQPESQTNIIAIYVSCLLQYNMRVSLREIPLTPLANYDVYCYVIEGYHLWLIKSIRCVCPLEQFP